MRGILATCYVRLREELPTPELTRLYREFYQQAPFVQVLDEALPS